MLDDSERLTTLRLLLVARALVADSLGEVCSSFGASLQALRADSRLICVRLFIQLTDHNIGSMGTPRLRPRLLPHLLQQRWRQRNDSDALLLGDHSKAQGIWKVEYLKMIAIIEVSSKVVLRLIQQLELWDALVQFVELVLELEAQLIGEVLDLLLLWIKLTFVCRWSR